MRCAWCTRQRSEGGRTQLGHNRGSDLCQQYPRLLGGIMVPKSAAFKPNKRHRSGEREGKREKEGKKKREGKGNEKGREKEGKRGQTRPGLAHSLWDLCFLSSRDELVLLCGCSGGCCCAVKGTSSCQECWSSFIKHQNQREPGQRENSAGKIRCSYRTGSWLSYKDECKCLAGQVDGTPNKPVCGYKRQNPGNTDPFPQVRGHQKELLSPLTCLLGLWFVAAGERVPV